MPSGVTSEMSFPVRVAELRWLEVTVVRHAPCSFPWLNDEIRAQVSNVVERLAWATGRAVEHEGGRTDPSLRDEVLVAYAERVATTVTGGRTKRRLVRVMWRLHSPRSWIFRQVKVATFQKPTEHAPIRTTCTLGKPIPRKAIRNYFVCRENCDARFYLQEIGLSYAELGMLLGMPKSTASNLADSCPRNRTPTTSGMGPSSSPWTPAQVAHYWDCLRGSVSRTAPAYSFSWRRELAALFEAIWMRLR